MLCFLEIQSGNGDIVVVPSWTWSLAEAEAVNPKEMKVMEQMI